MIFTLKEFRHYLIANKFKLYKDHKALKYVFNAKDSHGRIDRWFTLLAEYNFEFCYPAVKDNAIADYLSRPAGVNLTMSNAEMESDLKIIANFLNDFASPPRARTLVKS